MRKYVFLVGCLLGMILMMFPVQAHLLRMRRVANSGLIR